MLFSRPLSNSRHKVAQTTWMMDVLHVHFVAFTGTIDMAMLLTGDSEKGLVAPPLPSESTPRDPRSSTVVLYSFLLKGLVELRPNRHP